MDISDELGKIQVSNDIFKGVRYFVSGNLHCEVSSNNNYVSDSIFYTALVTLVRYVQVLHQVLPLQQHWDFSCILFTYNVCIYIYIYTSLVLLPLCFSQLMLTACLEKNTRIRWIRNSVTHLPSCPDSVHLQKNISKLRAIKGGP